MKNYSILALVLILIACNTTDTTDTSSEEEAVLRTQRSDTTITYSIAGLSAEGSEVKAHYINDSIVDANWDIFSETGQLNIKYVFGPDGAIHAEEKHFGYKTGLQEPQSQQDVILSDSINYKMDSTGRVLSNVPANFTNVYADFKSNVPLVLSGTR